MATSQTTEIPTEGQRRVMLGSYVSDFERGEGVVVAVSPRGFRVRFNSTRDRDTTQVFCEVFYSWSRFHKESWIAANPMQARACGWV